MHASVSFLKSKYRVCRQYSVRWQIQAVNVDGGRDAYAINPDLTPGGARGERAVFLDLGGLNAKKKTSGRAKPKFVLDIAFYRTRQARRRVAWRCSEPSNRASQGEEGVPEGVCQFMSSFGVGCVIRLVGPVADLSPTVCLRFARYGYTLTASSRLPTGPTIFAGLRLPWCSSPLPMPQRCWFPSSGSRDWTCAHKR